MTRRHVLLALGATAALLGGIPLAWSLHTSLRFPSDRSPEGAYVRIALAFSHAKLRDCFAYLETPTQHALFTILDYRKKSLALIRGSFEEPERSRWLQTYQVEGDVAEPADLWVVMAREHGWDVRLRRDLSGIRSVEVVADRATIETVQGTRYPFRRAENGIWGLTLFTADLVAYKERAARDYSVIERAAADYERAKTR